MINKEQLREFIKDTLEHLDELTGGKIPYSDDAVELLMMTAAHESHLGSYIKQVGGPALGIFQMEPETYYDIHENYIEYRPWLESAVISLCPMGTATAEAADELLWNLKLQVVMARVHYFRVPHAIPSHKEPRLMAQYAKQFYNTYEGKALVQDYLDSYLDFC